MGQENPSRISKDPLADARWNKFAELAPDRRETVLRTVLGSIGVPERYRANDFPGWYEFENDIGAAWRNGKNPTSLILVGAVGTGKTGILCAALRSVVASRLLSGATVQTEWWQISETFRLIHYRDFTQKIRCFDDPGERWIAEMAFNGWCEIPLLVMDDMMDGTRGEWDLIKLGELIDRRYNAQLPIWISSNISTADLKKWPGFERSYSRLYEMAGATVYELTGKDRRIKK